MRYLVGLLGLSFGVVLAGPGLVSVARSGSDAHIYLPRVVRPSLNAVLIQGDRSFLDDGTRYVVGEVVNDTAASVYFALITAQFFDGSDQLVASQEAYVYLTRIAPGGHVPFKLGLRSPPPSIARYHLEVSYQHTSVRDYLDVTVLDAQIRDNQGVEIFGDLRNDQSAPLSGIAVAATFYDANGDVLDADFGTSTSAILQPGHIAGYQVSTFEQFTPSRLVVQAQGSPVT